jgi:hypothetical protein
VDIELASSRVRALLQAWDDYKRERMSRRFEHHDYVDICLENGYVPDIRLLGIDEFQDLSPVEYGLFKQWRDSEDIDWIYIAGDVNQCVAPGEDSTHHVGQKGVREQVRHPFHAPG